MTFRVECLILCGGRSSRMGRPKEFLPWGGEPLLVHLVRQLSAVSHRLCLVAAPDQTLPSLPESVTARRDEAEGLGPLNGFATGLRGLSPEVKAVYLCACDLPLMRPEFVRRVVERLASHDIAIPVKNGFPQPLAAAYRVEGLLARVEALLDSGSRRLIDLLPGADVHYLQPEEFEDVDPRLESLRNINTPEEYATLLRESEGRDLIS